MTPPERSEFVPALKEDHLRALEGRTMLSLFR